MKVSWANGIRRIVVFALLYGATWAQAQAPDEVRRVTAPAGPLAAASSVNDAPVLAMRIVTEDGRVLSELPARLSVEIGKPLDRVRVSESLRALYRTGDYADVRAVATPVEGGVRLDFIVR
jgi:outer membrane protein assembly factor BamA